MEPQDQENGPGEALPPYLKEVLKRVDPTWSGRTPHFAEPIPLDAAGQAALRQLLGPTLRVPLDLAQELRQQLTELVCVTGREELARSAEALGRLVGQQFPETRPLGRAVQVCRNLKVIAFLGGWGPGPEILHPGTRIYLISQRGDKVIFGAVDGPRSIPEGQFLVSDLDAVQDLVE